MEQCCLQGGRVLVVGVSKWFKDKMIKGNRPDVTKKWSGDSTQLKEKGGKSLGPNSLQS